MAFSESIDWHDGQITQFAEGLPGVGFGVSACHYFNGDCDGVHRAKRAAASSSNSSSVTIGAIIGGSYGGIPGAAGGAFVGSAVGQCLEKGINQHIPDNRSHFRTDGGTFDDFETSDFIKNMAVEALVAGATFGASTYLGRPAAKLLLEETESVLGKAVKSGVAKPFGVAARKAGKTVLKTGKRGKKD